MLGTSKNTEEDLKTARRLRTNPYRNIDSAKVFGYIEYPQN